MAFTFAPALTTTLDQVRAKIGDISAAPAGVLPGGANLDNATIAAYLTASSDNVLAAAVLAAQMVMAAWISSPMSYTADGLTINRGDMVARWQAVMRSIQADAALLGTLELADIYPSSINNDETEEA